MKLIVHLPDQQEPFQQTTDASWVPNVGELLGVQPNDREKTVRGDRCRLGWVESRRFYLSANGEMSAEIWMTENPAPIVETTTIDSCRRAIQMERGGP